MITKIRPKGTQIGARTYHHDQSIDPVNFKIIKTIVRILKNPIPLVLLLLFILFLVELVKLVYVIKIYFLRGGE